MATDAVADAAAAAARYNIDRFLGVNCLLFSSSVS